jgi:hypothetical protein
METAKAKAEEYNIKVVTVDELLADPEIEIDINLTIPKTPKYRNQLLLLLTLFLRHLEKVSTR